MHVLLYQVIRLLHLSFSTLFMAWPHVMSTRGTISAGRRGLTGRSRFHQALMTQGSTSDD